MEAKMRVGVLLWSVLVPLLSIVSSCGSSVESQSDAQWFLGNKPPERIQYSISSNGRAIPEVVARFLSSADMFGRGVRQYRLGSYQKSVTDCSGFLGQAHRAAGHGAIVYQFDRDPFNFTQCHSGLRPGDVVLLAYPGRQPDHWIMMGDVVDKKFHSAKNVIMDVSSDYVGGVPYFKGELGRRRNLMARSVYACRRHRTFDKAWRQLDVQLREDARKAAQEKADDGKVDPTSQEATASGEATSENLPMEEATSAEEAGNEAAVVSERDAAVVN
jgi:hypothetical protein